MNDIDFMDYATGLFAALPKVHPVHPVHVVHTPPSPHCNFHCPQSFGVSSASLGTSAVMAVALFAQ